MFDLTELKGASYAKFVLFESFLRKYPTVADSCFALLEKMKFELTSALAAYRQSGEEVTEDPDQT
jgi:hypothetical protein